MNKVKNSEDISKKSDARIFLVCLTMGFLGLFLGYLMWGMN